MAVVRLRPADLRSALASDGTSLQFQVQVHVPTGTLAGVEALVRWPHPALGMVGPQEIVQLVEAGGLQEAFDHWVIRTACAQAAAWIHGGVPLPLISVNVFEPTLRAHGLFAAVTDALEAAGAGTLELELPRGATADPALVALIGSLRTRGVRIAVEAREAADLPAIDVDTVKLPYGLTSQIATRAEAASAIVAAARDRKLRVVGEGVETREQQAALLGIGCETLQGYVFGPEVSASEVGALARQRVS